MNTYCDIFRRRGFLILPAAVLMASLLFGCSLSAPYPNKSLYTINVTAPAQPLPQPQHKDIRLRVRRFVALAPFNEEALVSRLGPNTLRKDYYNVFAAPPADIITNDFVQWLRGTQSFGAVVDGNSSSSHQWVLEGRIEELSINISNPQQPQAVITLGVLLIDDSGAEGRILLEKSYTQRVVISSSDPATAAAGWSAASGKLFAEIASDLNATASP